MIRSMVASSSSQAIVRRGVSAYNKGNNNNNSTIVVLSALPTSATLTDVRALSYKPPKPTLSATSKEASTPRDSSSSSLAASITKIEFVRTKMLNVSGKVVVYFRDKDRAAEFAETAHDRVVGGNRIKAQLSDRALTSNYPVVSLLYALQRGSPGRVVLIKGLPAHFTSGRLEKVLSRSYPLATEPVVRVNEHGIESDLGPVTQIRDMASQSNNFSTFFVRFQTVSGAMMLIRRWHRIVWNTRDEERFKYNKLRTSVDEDDVDEESLSSGSKSGSGQGGERNVNSNWSPREDNRQPEDELSRIVDALLMY